MSGWIKWEGGTDIPQWAWDRMKAEYIEKDGMAASFARYVMTKEEAVDVDALAANVLYQEAINGTDKCPTWEGALLRAIKRGRELERGEVK